MLKYSRQRESIQKYLDAHRTHPTAETVYRDLRKEYPNISLGTVYRNLNLLAEMGEILRISSGIGPDHFDGNVQPHCHFICTNCGSVLDIEIGFDLNLEDFAKQNFQGMIASHVTHFFGLCPECYHNKK